MSKIAIISSQKINYDHADIYTEKSQEKDICCDVLLCLNDAPMDQFYVHTNLAIVCGDRPIETYKNVVCKNLITYGMASYNTATLSSILEDKLSVAFQRDIICEIGSKVDISEVVVDKGDMSDIDILGISVLNCILK